MIVDASAIVAIMHEAGSEPLAERFLAARLRRTHAISVYEAALASARIKERDAVFGRAAVEDFCAKMDMTLVALGEAEAAAALDAFARYGRGRHPAALNMGDCFSYACAKRHRLPLLYKGEDFALTDLA